MRTSIVSIQKMKHDGKRIPVITAYDAASARLVEAAGIPIILVGDSLGMTIQGHETTLPVTLDEMIYHTRAVVRGTSKAMLVLDLPFMTYAISTEQAMASAARAIQEGGATAVKLEGGTRMAPTVARLVEAGIPVMGHIGLTPQSVHQLGGWRVQGRDAHTAQQLIDDALALEQAGAFSIVLETIPAQLAKEITRRLRIPTIGIGAGPDTDGQVQVFHDVLGLTEEKFPKHAKAYATLAKTIRDAVSTYISEVQAESFPTEEHSFSMDESELSILYGR